MRITILFGGTNKERLVSVASAQALHRALPEADLWFWHVNDTVHEVRSETLLDHKRPFEDEFDPGTRGIALGLALDKAKAEGRVLLLGLHGGRAENGELQAMCEMRGLPFTGSGSASSNLAFDKTAAKRFAAIAGLELVLERPLVVEKGFRLHFVHGVGDVPEPQICLRQGPMQRLRARHRDQPLLVGAAEENGRSHQPLPIRHSGAMRSIEPGISRFPDVQ